MIQRILLLKGGMQHLTVASMQAPPHSRQGRHHLLASACGSQNVTTIGNTAGDRCCWWTHSRFHSCQCQKSPPSRQQTGHKELTPGRGSQRPPTDEQQWSTNVTYPKDDRVEMVGHR
eukprot:2525749-Amphidinium_carterae.1